MPKLKNTEKQKYEEEIEGLKNEVFNLKKRGQELEDLLGAANPLDWAKGDGEINIVNAYRWEKRVKALI